MLRINLLGAPQVEVDGQPLVVDTRKAIALLAYLAVVDRPIARDSLSELLWPDADPDGARGALRRTLSTLRSGLGGRWVRVDRRQAELMRDDIEVDVRAFRAGVAEGGAGLSSAVGRYRGDFLEGFALRDSATFDEWQLLEAEALRGELAQGLRQLVTLESAAGRSTVAIAAARRLVALDPLDEAAHQSLMRLHASAGDRAAAIHQYRECVRILDRELGVAPSAETTGLYESLLARETSGAAPPVDVAPLSDVERELLEAAAVLGDEVDPDLVREVSGRSEEAAVEALEALASRGVLREPRSGEAPDRYRYADPSARFAVLEGLGIARRRTLGRRAADAHLRAGHEARLAGGHDRAAEHYRAALALGHPERLEVHEALGDVETLRGRYGEALAAYEFGAAHADPAHLPEFEHRLGALHLRRGAFSLADLHLGAALSHLDAAPSVLRARLLADRSLVATRRAELVEGRRLARAALREARRVGDPESESQAENLLALLARRAGELEAARRHLRRSLDKAGRARQPGARVAALNNLALLERAAGNLDSALALTDEALRRITLLGDRHREAALRNNRADLLHALGRRTEAEEEQRRAVAAFAEVGERPGLEPEIWKLVEW